MLLIISQSSPLTLNGPFSNNHERPGGDHSRVYGPGEVIDTLNAYDVSYLHVVNGTNELTGIISFRDIRPLLHEGGRKSQTGEDIAATDAPHVLPRVSILPWR